VRLLAPLLTVGLWAQQTTDNGGRALEEAGRLFAAGDYAGVVV